MENSNNYQPQRTLSREGSMPSTSGATDPLRVHDAHPQFSSWSSLEHGTGTESYTHHSETPVFDQSPFSNMNLGTSTSSFVPSHDIEAFLQCPGMTDQYLDLAYAFPGGGGGTDFLHPIGDHLGVGGNDDAAPSPEGSATSSSSLGTHSALEYELPRVHQPQPYPLANDPRQFNAHGLAYPDPSSTFYPASPHPHPQRPIAQWGTQPSYLPHISHSARQITLSNTSMPQILPYPQYSVMPGRFPTMDEVRRWPQMFNNLKGTTVAKKPALACEFCRSRKIGCVRPGPDEPDQTCNQCVRRKRGCVYPTESRRGQHARRRRSTTTKSTPPTLVTPTLPPGLTP
ncbi:hypothetical protein C8R46DRAFT_1301849 [Mycena filopes]|nr:hypothetical protein C8R46DRAFT_1301849 [Mycena filopes]